MVEYLADRDMSRALNAPQRAARHFRKAPRIRRLSQSAGRETKSHTGAPFLPTFDRTELRKITADVFAFLTRATSGSVRPGCCASRCRGPWCRCCYHPGKRQVLPKLRAFIEHVRYRDGDAPRNETNRGGGKHRLMER